MSVRRLQRSVLLLLAGAICALALAAPSQAACGGVVDVPAAHHPRGQSPPLAIGDSTMLLAAYPLASAGFEVNAHGCRQWPEALALIRARKAAGQLPHMVVIALGANGYVTSDDVGLTLGVLCCHSWLVLVTPRQLGGGSGSNAAVEREDARRHRNRTILLDWVTYSAGHGDWFQPDGLHLTTPGATAFTALLKRAFPDAYPKPRRKRRRHVVRVAADPTLSVRLTHGALGYVGAVIIGPAGARVRLSRQFVRTGATRALGGVDLIGGRAELPRLLPWGCGPRSLRVIAATVPPAAPATAVAAITTPGCSRRLRVTVTPRAAVGGAARIAVHDRWGIGAVPLSLCVAPPGAARHCRPWGLRPGHRAARESVPVPRPGGWRVSVWTRYGTHFRALVWAAHRSGRLRVLLAGDSEMQILDGLIAQDLAGHGVDVTSDARISTGLTNPGFFDWQRHASGQAGSLRPDVTMVFIGANDGFDTSGPHGPAACCGHDWSAGYAALVARMMRAYLRGTAGRVYWFTLPVPRPGNFASLFRGVDAGIRAAAARFPGRVGLIDAASLFTPGGRYRDFMSYRGQGFVIHEPDGIHLSASSDGVLAGVVARHLIADRVVR